MRELVKWAADQLIRCAIFLALYAPLGMALYLLEEWNNEH